MSWKRILTEDDVAGTNLANTNLTQTAAENRTYTTASSTLLTIQTSTSDSAFMRLEDYGDASDTITFQANTGRIKFKGANNAVSGSLSLKQCDDNGNNLVTLAAPLTLAANYTLTLPEDNGDADQVLQTDGSGNLSWVDQSSGSVNGSGASGRLALWSTSATLTSDSGITYSSSEDKITAGGFTATTAGQGGGFFVGTGASVEEIHVANSLSPTNTDGGHGTGTRMFHKFPYSSTVIRGRVYFLRDGWVQADKDNANSANLLAVASNIATATTEMIAEGFVRMQSNAGFSNASAGTPVYIADDGHVSVSPPTGEGDIARVVGYVISGSAKMIYFRPDNTWITVD